MSIPDTPLPLASATISILIPPPPLKSADVVYGRSLILSNVITVGANCKFFTLTLNGLKTIAANQGNHVE